MSDYYSNSQQYHDDLDRFEARVRAEAEQEEFMKSKQEMLHRIALARAEQEENEATKPAPSLGEIYEAELERTGDYKKSAVAVEMALLCNLDGSDDSTNAQLDAAWFGSSAWFCAIDEIPF